MSQLDVSEQFDLSHFVLGYLEHAGGMVAPPAYGMHEALLPDELAAQLQVDSYLRLAFGAEAEAGALRLSVNHPLVEAMAEEAAQQPGHAQVAINHVRLEKPGLFDLAAKTFSFANARLSAPRNAVEQSALHHYLRFNFKATLLSDEKQEQIVSVVLDVQAGHIVRDPEHLARLVTFETETAFEHLAPARPRWPGASEALDAATWQALLLRAQAAAEVALQERLAAQQARNQRFLELDLARLEDYYGALERDLRRRLERADVGEGERRSAVESKIAALHGERGAKLADIRARYTLRVDLELINTLLTIQPKLLLPVEISNRRARVTRMAVWDPLLRRLEPLVCDVCGEPGEGLHLCTGGHLAHRNCLAPQCVECNREYCRLCADQVLACVVCKRPVCQASSRLCPDCGRVTCSEHVKLCHAADGQPAVLPKAEPPAQPPPPAAAQSQTEAKTSAKPKSKPAAKTAKLHSRTSLRPAAPAQAKPAVKAVRINVELQENYPRLVAFVMRSTNRVLATRTIELTPTGIHIECQCEKGTLCPADGYLFRPAPLHLIQEQVKSFLDKLQQEYNLPAKRVQYFTMHGSQVTERQTLVLPAIWRDPGLLSEAQQGFDQEAQKRR
jgi:hypothetical protein